MSHQEEQRVNRKARRRLLIAVAVVVVAFAAGVVYLVWAQGAYYRQVGELSVASELDGKTVKVGGTVVPGSFAEDGTIQSFAIRDLTGYGATVNVKYGGTVPDTFGPDVDVVVLGVYDAAAGLITAEELQTKCPSKYEGRKSPDPAATTGT
jgi:cytochrome c-type biogenesis protein CcmE